MKASETGVPRIQYDVSIECHTKSARKRTLRRGEQTMQKGVTMPKNERGSVRVGLSRTYNLGDFESLRIEVAVEMPTPPDLVEASTDRAKEIALNKLIQYQQEALADG